jgi:hypothetical protein
VNEPGSEAGSGAIDRPASQPSASPDRVSGYGSQPVHSATVAAVGLATPAASAAPNFGRQSLNQDRGPNQNPNPNQNANPDLNSPGPSQAGSEEESTQDLAPETAPHQAEDTEEASLALPHGAMPAPLRGSLESLERQNSRLDSEGLERILDEDDLAQRIAHGLLVPVPVSSALTVNAELPPNHRYCRPWTARFLADLAREHEAAFHRPLEVNSAVRTVEYQERLMRINGNAAPAEGDIVSPHLTGATIDIAKEGLSREEMGWMRRRLLALQSEGKIDVEEEFRQACFHITVYKTYDSAHPTHRPSQPPADAASDSGAEGF